MAEEKSRTLKLSILGDVDNLLDAFKKAEKATNNHVDDLKDYAKKATMAFAAVGAAAGAFAISAVKNALEDEAAQRKLAETLRVTTNATNAQIASVEQWITKTSVAIGVSDDELRPSLSRLARSTNDITEAQKLLNLALDISAATGKPLEAVSNALGKAYDGNAASLGRLGLGLDASILKSKDFNAIYGSLQKTFGTFAEQEAETTIKKFERFKIALDESKESIGAALMPVVEKLADFLLTTAVPVMDSFVAGLTGSNGLVDGASKGQKQAYEFGEQLKKFISIVVDLKEEILLLAGVMGTVFVVSKITAFVTGTVAAIKALIGVYNTLKTTAFLAGVAGAFAANPALGVAAGAAGLAGMALLAQKIDAIGGGGGTDLSNLEYSYIPGMGGGGRSVTTSTGKTYTTGSAPTAGQTIAQMSKGLITSETDLLNKLTDVQDKISEITFAQKTGQLSDSQAAALLKEQQKSFDNLTNIADVLVASAAASASGEASALRNQAAANYYITVNAPIATEDAAKVIVDTITESANRGGAASGLAAKLANLP